MPEGSATATQNATSTSSVPPPIPTTGTIAEVSPTEKADPEQGWFKTWTVRSALLLTVVVAVTTLLAWRLGVALPPTLTTVELEILGFTIAVLILVAIYGSRSSATQNRKMRDAFRTETSNLIEANQQHWAEQAKVLTDATSALRQSLELQGRELKVATDSLDLDRRLLELEEQRRQRLKPVIALALDIPTGSLIKHMILTVYNAGMDGHGLVVFFGIQPQGMLQQTRTRIDAQQTTPLDFGDISQWPDSAVLSATAEVSDASGAKYRFSGQFQYDRNRGALGSSPTWSPPYLFPTPEPVN